MIRGHSPISSLAERLAGTVGLDPSSLDDNRMRSIVEARCRRLGLADPTAYLRYLDSEPAELDALIDEVVVLETRFFRDAIVFQHIRSAVPRLAEAFPGELRVLSAPCGTGQEAYSLAAALQQAGLPASRFSIDAFDISLSALSIARRGIYTEKSLRHLPAELREVCGRTDGNGWQVHDALRERVRFERRNLAEAGALGEAPGYHLILCRNLFIYLHPHARRTLAKSLATALIPGGRLVIGTADRVEELASRFSPVRPASSFALVLKESKQREPLPAPAIRADAAQEGPSQSYSTATARLPVSHPRAAPVALGAAELYQSAVHHQENGNLRKAERRCRQALYLEPDFLPALELLQLFWLQQPKLRLRNALRDRILRARAAAQELHRAQATLDAERNPA